METAENLVLQWKLIAICSLFLSLLLVLLLAIVFRLRFDAGRASGAKDFYVYLTSGQLYHTKLGLFFKLEKFVQKEIKEETFRNHALNVSERLTLN